MKLELKYLAPYLPYKPLCYANAFNLGLKKPLKKELDTFLMMNLISNDTQYKLYLRPLSELNIDGEENTPEHLQGCCYSYITYLLESHYDVFGLIDKGLAIDINTIKND